MKTILNLATIASLAIVGGSALAAAPATHVYVGQKLAAKAKVTMAQATAIALKAHPGRVTDKELENEGGGSGLRYSFDIASGGKTFEVGVDAKSGAVLENKKEGKNPD
jgi:uncharacterized membrane protein YkoI